MTRRTPGGVGAYARALETALSRLRGKPTVLSPRDWALASDWFSRGVPLALVLEALEEAASRSGAGSGRPAASLAYVAPAVEEAWDAIRRGRIHPLPDADEDGSSFERAGRAWELAAERAGESSRLASGLRELLGRLAAGASPESVDADLDERLPSWLPESVAERAHGKVRGELEAYRDRMGPDAFRDTLRRGVADELRRSLGLPRLALGRR